MPGFPCPKCKAQFDFDFNDIMEGKEFTCSNCNLKISLSYQDNKTTLLKAQEKLNDLKNELGID